YAEIAYWGVAYIKYFGGTRRTFRCPSARLVDEWRETGLNYPDEYWLNSTYGINQWVGFKPNQANPSVLPSPLEPRKLSAVPSPSTMVFATDSFEQKTEGPEDTLGLFPGFNECLTEWKQKYARLYPGKKLEFEYFRHNRNCNVLWAPGNVSTVKYTPIGYDY